MKYLIILVLLSGCGSAPGQIDPVFQPYVDNFVEEGMVHERYNLDSSSLSVQFGDHNYMASQFIVGFCDYGQNSVQIDPVVWANWANYLPSREQLIYHELGHCLLHRQHRNDEIQDPNAWLGKRPVSIMHASVFNYMDYENHRTDYVNELFNHN